MTTTLDGRITELMLPEADWAMPSWQIVVVLLEGITDLLLHNPAAYRGNASGGVAAKNRVPTPEEEAELGAYRASDGSGALVVRADMVRQAAINAARSELLKLDRKRPLWKALAGGLLFVPGVDEFPLLRDGQPLLTWDRIDVRRVVVQRQGVLRARPLVRVPWAIAARFLVDRNAVGRPENVVNALAAAGQRHGIGDYRPERGGSFGRFAVARAWLEEP